MRSIVPSSWSPVLRSLLRIVAALSFVTHGTQKLFATPLLRPGTPAPLFSLFGAAGVLETFGGALLLIGLFSRPAAFVLSGEMAVAYFYGHAGRALFPILNGGELATLYCFIWLYVASAGPGPLSVDALRSRSARSRS